MLNMKFAKSVCWWLTAFGRSSCCMQVWRNPGVGMFTCLFYRLLNRNMLFCTGFLFWTLHLDIWAPFLSTVNHNTINRFCMQVSVHPSIFAFPLPWENNCILVWFCVCCVQCTIELWERKVGKCFLSLEQKVLKLVVVLRCSVSFLDQPYGHSASCPLSFNLVVESCVFLMHRIVDINPQFGSSQFKLFSA